MNDETFSQKYNELMTLAATTLDSGIASVIVSNLRNPAFILEYLENVSKEQAVTYMLNLSSQVDREGVDDKFFAEKAKQMAREFAKLMLVREKWYDLIGLCDGPNGFKQAFAAYIARTY